MIEKQILAEVCGATLWMDKVTCYWHIDVDAAGRSYCEPDAEEAFEHYLYMYFPQIWEDGIYDVDVEDPHCPRCHSLLPVPENGSQCAECDAADADHRYWFRRPDYRHIVD